MRAPAPAPRPASRRRGRRPRYWLRRLMVLLILLLPFAVWRGYALIRTLPFQAEGDAPRVVVTKPVYVALLGVDERQGDTGRSDTLMLVRLDAKAQAVDVVSVPRDTRVTYTSGKHSKINAAYAIDGPDLTTEALSDLLRIPRPYYVTLNFQAFEEIVDLLGGVDLYVDRHYVYDDPTPSQNLHIDIPAGEQHMNGETALKFVRMRYDGVTNSDIARIDRQQQFLKALQMRIAAPSSWGRIPSTISTMRKYVHTNLPEADQLKLAEALFKARNNLTMTRLPGTPDDATGDWLLAHNQWDEVMKQWDSR